MGAGDRYNWAYAALAAALFLVASRGGASEAQEESKGLVADVTVAYVFSEGWPGAQVTWTATLTNTGPAPLDPSREPLPQFPESTSIAILGDGLGLEAHDAGGGPLNVSIKTEEDGHSGFAIVHFGRALAYGDALSFTLTYAIPPGENDVYILTDRVVSLPFAFGVAVDTYVRSMMKLTVPPALVDHVLIGVENCTRAGTTFECSLDGYAGGVDLEIVDPDARLITRQEIDVNGRRLQLTLRYLEGDETWAEHVSAVTARGLPVLESLLGTPYPGPDGLRISEKASNEIWGAAGVAGCNVELCGIAVAPASDDLTLLHELSHVWTHSFHKRWLSEGTAEFISQEAAARMGIENRYPTDPRNEPPFFPLNKWGSPTNFITAPEEVLLREFVGYDRSARFLQLARDRVGWEAIQATYRELVPRDSYTVTSRDFMDALENHSGVNLDEMFAAWIFHEEMQPELAARRQARDRYNTLNARVAAEAPELSRVALDSILAQINDWKFAEATAALDTAGPGFDAYLQVRDRLVPFKTAAKEAGLPYPIPFQRAEDTLDFAPVHDSIAKGEEAIAVYREAAPVVNAPRSLWQKIGLFWKDPDGQLNDAEGAFGWASFDESMAKARAARETVEGAAAGAPRNLAIGVGVLLALALGGWFGWRWALKPDPPEAPEGEAPGT